MVTRLKRSWLPKRAATERPVENRSSSPWGKGPGGDHSVRRAIQWPAFIARGISGRELTCNRRKAMRRVPISANARATTMATTMATATTAARREAIRQLRSDAPLLVQRFGGEPKKRDRFFGHAPEPRDGAPLRLRRSARRVPAFRRAILHRAKLCPIHAGFRPAGFPFPDFAWKNAPVIDIRGLRHAYKSHVAVANVTFTWKSKASMASWGPTARARPPRSRSPRDAAEAAVWQRRGVWPRYRAGTGISWRRKIGYMPDHFSMYRQR